MSENRQRLVRFAAGVFAFCSALQSSAQGTINYSECRQRLRPEGYYDYQAADLPPDTPYKGETLDTCTVRCANTAGCGGFVLQDNGDCWLKNEDIGKDDSQWRDDNITHSQAYSIVSCLSSPPPPVQVPPPPASTQPSGGTPSAPTSGKSGSSSGPIIGAVVGGVLLLIVAAIAAIFFIRRKRNRKSSPGKEEHLGPVLPLVNDPNQPSEGAQSTLDSMTNNLGSTLQPVGYSASSSWNGPAGNSEGGPPVFIDASRKRELLTAQLDDLVRRQERLCGRFILLTGTNQRIPSGQGVVQFARHAFQEKQFAIKFYLDDRAFEVERAHFCNRALDKIRPDVESVEANNGSNTPSVLGYRLPPMVIIEKGESLDVYQKRSHPNEHGCISIMLDLLDRFIAMHEAGLVHRDIKPANVIWYETRNHWAVIDFGATATIGAEVPIACTLAYAAPEVLQALAEGRKTMAADPAVDVWSLGLVAWEILTRTRVFPPHSLTRENAWHEICQKLPWEQVDSPSYKTNMRSLGFMRNGILGMLKRQPQQRFTLQQVRATWRTILNPATITEALN